MVTVVCSNRADGVRYSSSEFMWCSSETVHSGGAKKVCGNRLVPLHKQREEDLAYIQKLPPCLRDLNKSVGICLTLNSAKKVRIELRP